MAELPIGWVRPTQEQSQRGVIAVLYEPYYCFTDRGLIVVDYSGGYVDNSTKKAIPKSAVYGIEYDTERMNRRIKYGGHIPKWVIPIAKTVLE